MWQLFNKKDRTVNEHGFIFAKQVLANKKIVIADDNGGTLTWLKYTLEEYYAKVYVFKHGQETIDFIKQCDSSYDSVDVLLLDIHMNNVGGIDIARANMDMIKPAKVVFLTGYRPDSVEFLEAQKLATVLQKPVGTEIIIKVIMNCLLDDMDSYYTSYIKQIKDVQHA